MNPLKSSRPDGRGLFVQSNQANFNFKCRRQACFSSPPLCSYDGLTTVELVRFPGKDSTNAGLSSLLINRPPVLKSPTCCFKRKAPQSAEYISLCSFIWSYCYLHSHMFLIRSAGKTALYKRTYRLVRARTGNKKK